MVIRRIEVRLLSLPTRRQLGAAHDPSPEVGRPLVVVGVEDADGAVGWGECSALAAPTYTHEWAEDSYERLVAWADGDAEVEPRAYPMTAAAIEMADLDRQLRLEGRSLAASLGATLTTVPAGATVGLGVAADAVADAESLVEQGYGRIKIKIEPGRVDDVPHALSHRLDTEAVELQVDANGSLGAEHFLDLLRLVDHGVRVIEQPFPVDRPDLAAEFISGCGALVMADEAVNDIDGAASLLAARAVGAVAIKPPRVGGIAAATELLSWCRAKGLPASVGGMLECGLGRSALAAIGALDGFEITGDLSPASQFLAADPWPDLAMRDGQIEVPNGPGVAPLPDLDALDHHTVRRHDVRR